jgi:hypothetical protein
MAARSTIVPKHHVRMFSFLTHLFGSFQTPAMLSFLGCQLLLQLILGSFSCIQEGLQIQRSWVAL